jgi:hypothetical protein
MFVIPEGNLRFDDAGAYKGVYRYLDDKVLGAARLRFADVA